MPETEAAAASLSLGNPIDQAGPPHRLAGG